MSVPPATLMLREPDKVKARLIDWEFAELSRMSPPSVIALPLSVNAPAVEAKSMPAKVVAAGKSSVLVVLEDPSKISRSDPAPVGAVPFQLAGLVHETFAPPPFQVKMAAGEG